MASARRIYGEKMDTMWGQLVPADPELLTQLWDGETINAAGLSFEVMETLGHARHHHTLVLDDVAFCGDAAGIQIAGGLVDIPAPPPEFDLIAWRDTVARLQARGFRQLYPTHFGLLADPVDHLARFAALLEDVAVWIKGALDQGLQRDQIVAAYKAHVLERAKAAGLADAQFHQYATANPHYMTVDGIMRYWQRQ